VVVGDFNTPPSPIGHLDKKSTKELELNDTIDLMDLTNVYRVFHPATHNIHSSEQLIKPSLK
jgi:hypothetical protein